MPFPWHANQCLAGFRDHPTQIISCDPVMGQKYVKDWVAEQVIQLWLAPALVHGEFTTDWPRSA
jgi:pyridoxal/pyridoxine/pyridoxamine kinase